MNKMEMVMEKIRAEIEDYSDLIDIESYKGKVLDIIGKYLNNETEIYNILENAEGWAQATLRNINHWIDVSLENAEIRNMLYALFGYINNILEKINMAESKLISLT